MATFTTVLFWLTACLALVYAIPLEQPITNSTEPNGDMTALSPYPYSLQILLANIPGHYYSWDIWEGPQGVAVNPCGDTRFKGISQGQVWAHHPDDYWRAPGFPRATKVKVTISNYANQGCYYISTGSDAGQLKCSYSKDDGTGVQRRSTYIVDCERDPQWDAPKMDCKGKDKQYRRGYMCEF